MSDFDLLLRGRERDIGIVDGKFAALASNLRGGAGDEIDATRMSIFPGVIDSHVHFNEPGRTDWEGFETGSRAAAAGGTTTIFDMPLNAHPPTIDGASFDAKRAAAEKSSIVDFGLWGGLVPGNLNQLKTLRDRGVIGVKAFMCNSGIDDFPAADESTLREGMKRAADLNLLVAVHAESEEITHRLTSEKVGRGLTTVQDYLDSRPLAAELEAIRTALEIAGETGCRLHVVHVSSAPGVELITQGRARGLDISCETCPHYLLLSEADMERLGAVAKCAPPLRAAAEQERLWETIAGLTTIGSDHSPSPWAMKERTNFFEAWGGISGCQHLLPLLIDASVTSRKISFPEIFRLTNEGVAARFALAEKGGIVVGKDADLTLIDLSASEIITAESLHYRHRHSPYVDRQVRSRILRTILRGQTIFESGRFSGRRSGKFIRPQSA